MNKQTTARMSMLLIAMLAQLSVTQFAQAESATDWGNWADSSDTPNNVVFNYTPTTNNNNKQSTNSPNPNAQPTPDQTRTATNGGNLVTETPAAVGDWVGYALYSSASVVEQSQQPICLGCNIAGATNLANLTLNPQSAPRTNPMLEGQIPGTLTIASDVAAFNITFDQLYLRNGNPNSLNFLLFGQQLGFEGVRSSNDGDFIVGNPGFEVNLQTATGDISNGSLTRYTGRMMVGKILPAADMAYLVGLNYSSYTFNGNSALGSQVLIEVNFPAATWSGTWGGNLAYNAFQANGLISGSTLTSTSVQTSSLTSQNGLDVYSGSVKGTLVGIANQTTEAVGVIGSTTLNVGASANSTTVVNDVFVAIGGNL